MNGRNEGLKKAKITIEVEGRETLVIEGHYFLVSVGTLDEKTDLISVQNTYGGDYAHLCRLAVGQCAYISKNFEKAVSKAKKKLEKKREQQ